jgi:hypothetical protein
VLLAACSGAAGQAAPGEPGGPAAPLAAAPLPTLIPSVTPTIPPTNTPPPTPTPVPSDTPTPSPTPSPTPTPVLLNGLPLDRVLLLPAAVREHIVEIAERGRVLGRDDKTFSRIGGSVSATFHLMGRFDTGPYDLGPYAELQPTIDQYAGSFSRVGQGAMRGLTAHAALDPAWSDDAICQPNETPADCEIRQQNPSVAIIVLGTNDIGEGQQFEEDMRALLAHLLDQGIVPILVTKADRFEGRDNRNNAIIRSLASELELPLLDFDFIAGTIPGRGMGADDVHLVLYDSYDYTDPRAFRTGYGVLNLVSLMMLDAVRQEIAP